MSRNPRNPAPALIIACAALVLAVSGFAWAVPVEFSDDEAKITPNTVGYTDQQQLPAAGVLMDIGAPPTAANLVRGPVVEPDSLALMGLGLVIIGFTTSVRSSRRRRRNSKNR